MVYSTYSTTPRTRLEDVLDEDIPKAITLTKEERRSRCTAAYSHLKSLADHYRQEQTVLAVESTRIMKAAMVKVDTAAVLFFNLSKYNISSDTEDR